MSQVYFVSSANGEYRLMASRPTWEEIRGRLGDSRSVGSVVRRIDAALATAPPLEFIVYVSVSEDDARRIMRLVNER